MGIAILSIADTKLCIDNKSRVTKNGNPTWLYQFKGGQLLSSGILYP